MTSREIGSICEKYAAQYMAGEGMEILRLNFYCREGEIDIVAREDEYTVFAEVKARKGTSFGEPCEAVTAEKQRRIILAAQKYLMEKNAETAVRFDVVEIIYRMHNEKPEVLKINHIRDAFNL